MPSRAPASTLLHLTDLHIGPAKAKVPALSGGHYWNSEATELESPKHDRRGLLGSLLDDLTRQKLRPDLVLVTGDLLDRGARSCVPKVRDFLTALAGELRLPRTRVVLVPGNHDVLRVPDPAARYAAYDAIRGGFYGTLREPFPAGTQPYHRVERHDFAAELGIEVVAFNSCEALLPPKQEHGSVGVEQRRRADALLAPTEGMGLFRIALMHHHLDRPTGTLCRDISVMNDAGALREWLVARRFQLVLHGHQHVDWEHVEDVRGWFMSVTAGGSAGVAGYGRTHWDLRLGYQVIVVDSAVSGRRLRREYDPQSRAWIAAGRGEAEVALRFGAGAAAVNKGPSGGPAPTRASLRRFLGKVLPTASQLDAFCVDHFADVAGQLSEGMTRGTKENLLLQMKEPSELVEALRLHDPDAAAKHEGLLVHG